MKLKTNKLLTLTLATGLVAMTAGCGGSKTPAATGGGGNGTGTDGDGDRNVVTTPADVAYSAWSGAVTTAADTTNNAFLAGTAAVAAVGSGTDTAANLTGLPSGEDATILTLGSQVTPSSTTQGSTKGLNALDLGGDDTNGVGFATTGTGDGARFVAGVIAGADLGQPITATTVTGTWAGLFQAVGVDAVRKAFTLTVTFSATADDTISALIPVDADAFTADAMSYYLSGTYNAAGVITGNILYGDFSDTATNPATALGVAETAFEAATAGTATGVATNGVGTLSGLIGEDGVLGAFYSSGADGTGATGFAGGFVASKTPDVGGDDPEAVYADWAAGATQAAGVTNNAFLAGTATGLTGAPSNATIVTLDLADQTHALVAATPGAAGTVADNAGTAGTNARTLGGDATNGVAFFTTGSGATARYFAGLHNTTDLGAPFVTADTAADWNGLIQTVSGTAGSVVAVKVFDLRVTFGTTDAARTISAHVTTDTAGTDFAAASYYLLGTYDANGVITGTVSYAIIPNTDNGRTAATANGTLSGLIGADGAIGAFYSTLETAAGYAGGFVATPTDIAAGTAIQPVAHTGDTVAYADLGTTVNVLTANGFLAGTATGLTFTQPSTALVPVTVSLGTGLEGGATFLETAEGAGAFYLAGIHSDTNLGSPISSTAEASGTWTGDFGAVGSAVHTTTGTGNITLTVAYGSSDAARTITALVPANDNANAHGTDGETSYYISATYNATGVVTGNVLYRDFATGNADDGAARTAAALALTTATGGSASTQQTVGLGMLTGLIGQSGAVGAFHSSGSDSTGASGYAGGFAVTRTPPGS